MKLKLLGIAFAIVMVLAAVPAAPTSAAYVRAGAYASTTAYLNLRSGPSTEYRVLRVIPRGGTVYVNAGPYNGVWYRVTYSGTKGYVHSGYLSQSGSYSASSSVSGLADGYAATTASLNLRTGPGMGYGVRLVIPYGGSVYVNAGPVNGGWYRVTYSGTTGYVYGSYLRSGGASSVKTARYSTSSSSTGTTYSTSTSYSSKGQAIANTAKRYVGYRYAYYGNTPSEGFSCVGFTQWVYRVNGISIPESLSGQASSGWAVSKGSLRPGDLVFFQNTWWRGLSHAGVYVGNGWMIDSSTPSTGIVWSNINSSYYAPRWWGARRLVN